MPILARLMNIFRFVWFLKTCSNCSFLGISKIERVNFEIHSCFCYLFLKSLFSGEVLKI